MRLALPVPARAPAKVPLRPVAARMRPPPPGGLSIAARCACGGSCPRCSGGAPLAPGLRQRMESRLGAPLGDVRVHTDAAAQRAAAARGAHAFTLGAHLFFAAGKFAPETSDGATRLAHELVHALQQRRGRDGDRHARPHAAEREARALGRAVAAGQRALVRLAAPRAVQHDGPGDPGAPAPQLQLDPQIERELLLRQFMRWWIGSLLVDGAAPDALPSPGADADGGTASGPPAGLPRLPSSFTLPPLQPDFFAPLPRDPFALDPDVGALFTPFHERGAPIGGGDDAAAWSIFRRNAAIARALPDLRAIAPRFVRPLIPATWRRDIAGALTGAAIGAALKNDYATPIEVGDRAWLNMTGASTTVVPLPAISFDLF